MTRGWTGWLPSWSRRRFGSGFECGFSGRFRGRFKRSFRGRFIRRPFS